MTMGDEVKNLVLDNRRFSYSTRLPVLSQVGTCPMVDIPLVDLVSCAVPYFARKSSNNSLLPSPKLQKSH